MRRLVLALVALVIPLGSWGPYVFSGGGEAAPACGDGSCTVYTENCSDLSEWTDVSESTGAWAVDTDTCNANGSASNQNISMVQGPLVYTRNFCYMAIVQDVAANAHRTGCTFGAAVVDDAPGNHYFPRFNNISNDWQIPYHTDNTHADVAADQVDGIADCGCAAWPGDIAVGDFVGITRNGTGDSTAMDFYDFGATPPSDTDDPSTWGTPTCSCSASEIAAATDNSDSDVGGCGPEAENNAGGGSGSEANIDDFICGEW